MQLTLSLRSIQPFSKRYRGLIACDATATVSGAGCGCCVDGREMMCLVYDFGQTGTECLAAYVSGFVQEVVRHSSGLARSYARTLVRTSESSCAGMSLSLCGPCLQRVMQWEDADTDVQSHEHSPKPVPQSALPH